MKLRRPFLFAQLGHLPVKRNVTAERGLDEWKNVLRVRELGLVRMPRTTSPQRYGTATSKPTKVCWSGCPALQARAPRRAKEARASDSAFFVSERD